MLPHNNTDQTRDEDGLLAKKDRVIQPLSQTGDDNDNAAANVIRTKIKSLYDNEPRAKEELAEAKSAKPPLSKHQKFMDQLSRSGKSLAEIQTDWHNYYVALPDHEKHEVWREFYANHGRTAYAAQPKQHGQGTKPGRWAKPSHKQTKVIAASNDSRSASGVKYELVGKIQKRTRLNASKHKSLIFGLSMGLLTLLIMLLGFFNERFIAPFIAPSRNVSSTPIIADATAPVGPESKIIIPKINVEVPVVYDEPSVAEDAIQRALENGIVHYATTSKPGELGNTAIFGHSSNNILNRGKYKFAFVLLSSLEKGDTFMLHYDGKRYIYKVYEKKVVPPNDFSVLEKTERPAVVSLITCDPPGTSVNRLVVIGEQISPDPAANIASSGVPTSEHPEVLPANAPSLWSRLVSWFAS